jgi:hypothetical protein
MSTSSDLQSFTAVLLEAPRAMPVPGIPVVRRREKEPINEIEAAIARASLCLYVMPPLPIRALQGAPFLFFDRYEVRVRIIENPASNEFPVDAYELVDYVALALHWSNPGGILAHPLQISTRPTEMVESPETRIIDVIFDAQLQLNPPQS